MKYISNTPCVIFFLWFYVTFMAEVPNQRVAAQYRAMEELLLGRKNLLEKMWIDMTLCYLLCIIHYLFIFTVYEYFCLLYAIARQ